MKKYLFLLFIIFLFLSCLWIKNRPSINCIRAFKGTEAQKLSKAVMFQYVSEIRKLCKKNPPLMYIEDKELHYTLLHFAVKLNKYKSAKALLELGMSANVQSSLSGETPLFLAARHSDINIKIMKLLAEYGADPELGAMAEKAHLFSDGETPLMQLPTMCVSEQKSNLEKAKFLVEYLNANVDAKDKDGKNAAIKALLVQNVEMAYYFIVELKADVTQTYYSSDYVVSEGENKKQFLPVSILKDWWIYPTDSKEYKIKLEIIKEFERQGVDYNFAEPSSSLRTERDQNLIFTTLTKPKILAEEAITLERKLKNLPMVTDAAVYDYDDNPWCDITNFDIELKLKNGDNVKLCGVKSDMSFLKNRSAGIRRINKDDFFLQSIV